MTNGPLTVHSESVFANVEQALPRRAGAHAVVATFTVLYFGPISRTAGLLMLPYVSWLIFSASLNLYAALNN
ncbi:hypothetical protein AU252_13255 [Pseudarthrobacter sulfonivorans]|uniref:TspO protein n=1 Tax=Pseudarthrobacter sulfonivorans TaxID=121292 RepID=A0A0U3GS11_9MICC|nr:hypothetical protein AU252_13255 [Pseudarthrobacter sulfonivorans]